MSDPRACLSHAASPSSERARPAGRAPVKQGAMVVELVGPAGAGKTTVLQAIRRRDATIRTWQRFRRLRRFHLFTWHALVLTPTACELLWKAPRITWTALRHLLRLRTLRAVLSALPADAVIILDEGPVYSLCRLSLLRTADSKSLRFERAWRAAVDQWRRSLSAVVYLDAPNPVLADRIGTRSKSHEIKEDDVAAQYGFLERFRRAYLEILARLETDGSVRVMTIDTAEQSVDQAGAAVLAALAQLRCERDTEVAP